MQTAQFQPADLDTLLRADLLLDVGSDDADEKTVRIFTNRAERLARLPEALAPLRLHGTTSSEGPTP